MRLRAWLHPKSEAGRDELLRAIHPEAFELVNARYGVAVGTSALERAFAAADAGGGLWVSAGAVLTRAEMESLPFREPACRGTARETDRDHERNFAACTAIPLQDFGAEEPVRLVHGISLSQARLKPNAVACVGEWTDEYILGAAVRQVFAAAGLSGYSLKAVANPRVNAPWDGIAQLYSASVMPKSQRDASIDRISSRFESEDGKLRQLGCLAYAADELQGRPDFNRTAEPWRWWGLPSWIVSSRVEQVFKRQRLRGWAFRPVFVTGTALYGEYLEAWNELRRLVSRTKRCSFEGGRW